MYVFINSEQFLLNLKLANFNNDIAAICEELEMSRAWLSKHKVNATAGNDIKIKKSTWQKLDDIAAESLKELIKN